MSGYHDLGTVLDAAIIVKDNKKKVSAIIEFTFLVEETITT